MIKMIHKTHSIYGYDELKHIVSLIDDERDEIAQARAQKCKDKGVRHRG